MVANGNAYSLWAAMKYDDIMEKATDRYGLGGQNNKISSFLQRLHPSLCLCGQKPSDYRLGGFGCNETSGYGGGELTLDVLIPQLLKDIDVEGAIDELQRHQQQGSPNHKRMLSTVQIVEARKVALEHLYELTCVKDNRVPIVCTCKWDIIPPLANCLLTERQKDAYSEVRRLACLTLNNISIPFDNKNVMMHGPHSKLLLDTLVEVVRMRVPETYLCCITLMNLSYLKDAVEPIITYSPHKEAQVAAVAAAAAYSGGRAINTCPLSHQKRPRSAQKTRASLDPREWDSFPTQRILTPAKIRQPTPPRHLRSYLPTPWLEDPRSLLRSLESLMRDQQPFLMSTVMSAESESIRWSIGLLRNLTKKDRHCAMVARTEIPALVLSFLDKSPHEIVKWTKDSLEDQALGLLGQLAVSKESSGALKNLHIVVILERIQRGAGATQSPCTTVVRDKILSILGSMDRY